MPVPQLQRGLAVQVQPVLFRVHPAGRKPKALRSPPTPTSSVLPPRERAKAEGPSAASIAVAAMSSLAGGCGLGLELWLGGLFSFSAAELAAAELLLQLGGEDEVASTRSSSRRSVSSWSKAGLTAEECVVKETASFELDRRARKRYRRVSDLYTDTIPVLDAPAAKKRRPCHGRGGDEIDKLWMVRFIVHKSSISQPDPEPWLEESITIENLKEQLVQHGLDRNDFMYYRSRVKSSDRIVWKFSGTNRFSSSYRRMFKSRCRRRMNTRGKMTMAKLTNDTTVGKMIEEYKSFQMVDLHCYSRPEGFVQPAPITEVETGK